MCAEAKQLCGNCKHQETFVIDKHISPNGTVSLGRIDRLCTPDSQWGWCNWWRGEEREEANA